MKARSQRPLLQLEDGGSEGYLLEREMCQQISGDGVMDHFQLKQQVLPQFRGLQVITGLLCHESAPLEVCQEELDMLSEGTTFAGRLIRMPMTSISRAATANTPNNRASGRRMPKRVSSA